MLLDFAWVQQPLSLNVSQLGAMSIMQAFMLAVGVLVALILLGALAALAGKWVSRSMDQIFEWLLLLALGFALAYLVLGGHLRLG